MSEIFSAFIKILSSKSSLLVETRMECAEESVRLNEAVVSCSGLRLVCEIRHNSPTDSQAGSSSNYKYISNFMEDHNAIGMQAGMSGHHVCCFGVESIRTVARVLHMCMLHQDWIAFRAP